MKHVLSIALVLFTAVTVSAQSKNRGTASNSAIPSGSANPNAGSGSSGNNPMANIFKTSDAGSRFHFSTNLIDLSKGFGAADLNFFQNEKIALSFRVNTSSKKEDVTKNDQKTKLTVDRTAYAVGGTYYTFGSQSRYNLLVGPAIAFGMKRDVLDVENQTGLSVKVTAMARFGRDFTVEGGGRMDNLEGGSFKGEAIGSLGYLF